MQKTFTYQFLYSKSIEATKRVGLTLSFILFLCSITLGQTPLVSLQNGKLVYNKYANEGETNLVNQIPDFSNAGYRGGGVSLPVIPIKETVSPIDGDCLQLIQAAIDRVSALPLDANGFRGAVLLKAGVYPVEGSLNIRAQGVVLRGEGNGVNGTVLIATKKEQHDLIYIRGTGSGYGEVSGTRVKISSPYVPVGSKTFEVPGNNFSVGDNIVIQKTPNDAWIAKLDMAQYGWAAKDYRITFERKVVAVSGNTVTIDMPTVDPIDNIYGGADVYKANTVGRVQECGVENMRIESYFASDIDENHGWYAVETNRAENCWVKDVVAKYFGNGAVNVSNMSKYITVEDCALIDPKSVTTGGRKYSFNIEGNSTAILFQRCMSWGGRHDFVSGSKVPGPNVYLDCVTEGSTSDSGPHHRYATGQLYDSFYGQMLRVQNRKASGSGHGWAGAQILFYNCQITRWDVKVESPPSARNWGIGCNGPSQNGNGYWESWGTPVLPRSLYLQQLEDRLGPQAVQNIATPDQLANTLRDKLRARINVILAEAKVPYNTGGGTPDNTHFDITDNGGTITAQYANTTRPTEDFPSLIDNLITTKYYRSGRTALWVQYQSTVPAIVVKYTITSGNDAPERDPKNWQLQGSNSGAIWTTLDTRTNESFASRRLTKTYTVENTTPYLYYRLNITAVNGGTGTQFSEWELIQRKVQEITFSPIAQKVYGDDPFEVLVNTSSGLPLNLEVVSGAASLDSGFLAINGAGMITLRATQAGNEQYFPATKEYTFEVQKATQNIAFDPVGDKTYGDAPFALNAASDASIPVSFEVVSGPVSIEGNIVTINGAGSAVIKASAAGNENYNPASLEQTFVINKAAQSISFAALMPVNKADTVTLAATSTSGLPVSYSVVSGPGIISGSQLTFNGEGQVTVKASQTGNENYLAAAPVDRTVLVYGDDSKKDGIRLQVYPNPTAGVLKVKLDNKKDKEYTFTIFNSQGVVVQSAVWERSHKMFEIDFNLENAEPGYYYLHVFDGTEKIVRTIIKK
jgi:hypothetical protein